MNSVSLAPGKATLPWPKIEKLGLYLFILLLHRRNLVCCPPPQPLHLTEPVDLLVEIDPLGRARGEEEVVEVEDGDKGEYEYR